MSAAILAGLIIYSVAGLDSPAKEATVHKVDVEVTPIAEPVKIEEPVKKEVRYAEPEQIPVEDAVVEAKEEDWDEESAKDIAEEPIEVPADLSTHDSLSYAYSRLNDGERTVYDEVYVGLIGYMSNVPVSTTDPAVLDKVFNCVMIDHPEIFYVNGYRYTKYTAGNVIRRIVFNGSYTYGEDERNSIMPDIDMVAQGILMNVYPDASDYDKIKYIFDMIVMQTEYDINSEDNQNVISVLLNKRSVCQGYAKTMQLLLNRLGIPCSLVTGSVSSGERHAWNIVCADGEWYYLDATWGDASYIRSDESEGEVIVPDINYDYLLVPYSEISTTHRVESVIDMPDCVSWNDNYYVREGLYFTDYDPVGLKAAFDRAMSAGAGYVALKCSDAGSYARMYSELVDNQHIFDYLPGKDVAYSYNEDTHKLLFALR